MPGLAALLIPALALAATPQTITRNIMESYEAAPHTFGPNFLDRVHLDDTQHDELVPLFREYVNVGAGIEVGTAGHPPPPPPPNGAHLSGVFSDRAVLQRAPAKAARPARTRLFFAAWSMRRALLTPQPVAYGRRKAA